MLHKKIQTALCSYGMSGRVFHTPLLTNHGGFELSDILMRSSKSFPFSNDHIKIHRDYDNLLRDPDLDLVVVNIPDHGHYEFAEKALDAGKHVVVEKPFTITSDQADRLIQLAKQKGKLVSVFQNRRWDSDFLTLSKVIEKGMLGRVVEFEAHFDRYRPVPVPNTWKEDQVDGTGILYNLGSHLIDQAIQLFGFPDSVSANLGSLRNGSSVPDYFHLLLQTQAIRIILKSSYLVAEPGPKYILHGEKGSFIKPGADVQEDQLSDGLSPNDIGYGVEPDWMHGTLTTFRDGKPIKEKVDSEVGRYMSFYDQIHHAIRDKKSGYVSGEEGKRVIQVIEAAQESNKTGRRVVL